MTIEKKTGWVDSSGRFHTRLEDARDSELRNALKRLVKAAYNFENPEDEKGVIDMLQDNSAEFYTIYQERFAPIDNEKDHQ